MTSLPLAQPPIATTPEVDGNLLLDYPVAIGVSGGKDSCATAFATVAYLDRIKHRGPRVLIHADLGATEWADSLPTCQRLAARLGLALVVVRRPQGDMMDRWEQRWRDNVRRWQELACVKLILPWSTPAMRFCTAELKIDQICRRLIAKEQPKLTSVKNWTDGLTWNPIADWSLDDVFGYLREQDFPLHEAYTRYGASRVSCAFCMIATQADHEAALRCRSNHALAERMVRLESSSTFSFQAGRWLGDTVRPILDGHQIDAVEQAKSRARLREEAEARIPRHLLYRKGWPECVPSDAEAALLAAVRWDVAGAVGIKPTFCNPAGIVERYRELMAKKAVRS